MSSIPPGIRGVRRPVTSLGKAFKYALPPFIVFESEISIFMTSASGVLFYSTDFHRPDVWKKSKSDTPWQSMPYTHCENVMYSSVRQILIWGFLSRKHTHDSPSQWLIALILNGVRIIEYGTTEGRSGLFYSALKKDQLSACLIWRDAIQWNWLRVSFRILTVECFASHSELVFLLLYDVGVPLRDHWRNHQLLHLDPRVVSVKFNYPTWINISWDKVYSIAQHIALL